MGATPRRSRRVWPFVVLGAITLLVAGYFIAEPIVRDAVEQKVATKIREALGLNPAHPVSVEIEGPAILQLVTGSFSAVHASSDNVTYGPVTGDVWGTGRDVHLDGSVSSWQASLSFSAEQLKALLPTDFFDWTTIDIEQPSIAFGGSVELFGVGVPLSLWMTPSADQGDLVLTPASFRVAGADVTAADIVGTFGKDAEQYVKPISICVQRFIPAGVTLADLTVDANRLVATASIDPHIADDKSLQENGTCR